MVNKWDEVIASIIAGICFCFLVSEMTACNVKISTLKAECIKVKSYDECRSL